MIHVFFLGFLDFKERLEKLDDESTVYGGKPRRSYNEPIIDRNDVRPNSAISCLLLIDFGRKY